MQICPELEMAVASLARFMPAEHQREAAKRITRARRSRVVGRSELDTLGIFLLLQPLLETSMIRLAASR